MRHSRYLTACVMIALTMLGTTAASAGDWRWGCSGALGDDQIAFNRDKLIVISGKTPAGKLDDFVRSGEFAAPKPPTQPRAILSTLASQADNGLEKTMQFGADDGAKLTLTEVSSKSLKHSDELIHHCRNEIIDRFRKTYRLERGGEPARTITLQCMEYTLTTRGGRTCR